MYQNKMTKFLFFLVFCLISGFSKDVKVNANLTTTNKETKAKVNEHQKSYMHIYYKWLHCMVVRQMAYAATKYETKAIAFLLSEGQSITLDSWMCLLPNQNDKLIVRWKFLAIDGTELSFIEQDGDKYFVHEDSKSLEITNVKKKDTGFYFANVNYEHDSAAYLVEVTNSDVYESHTTDSVYEPPEHVFPSRNLRISARMDEWSPCSRCDLVGVRQRFTTCFVEPHDYEKAIKPIHYPIMDMFIGGLPCRSAFLPSEYKQLEQVKNIKSIHEIGYCKIPCIEQTKENQTKGIVSLLSQTATNIMQRVFKSRTVVRAKNSGTILVCPDCWIGDQLAGTVKLVVKDRFVPPTYLIQLLPTISYIVIFTVLVIILGFKMHQNSRIYHL